ncbi:helix-turn-helix domain-containing protein [Clostridium felsineum]|nr:helix-turn-helix domain-containing protein [Clostridium felsineum]URZ15780.1 hypothetical protein CLFE_018270 [Clostridium felsineum DSM 794]
MSIGERIKQRRKKLNLSVDDIAYKLGKNRATVYRYESNDIENLPITVLEPLAKILETTPTYLLGLENAKNQIVEINPSNDEMNLIKSYRLLDSNDKYKVDNYIRDLSNNIKYINNNYNKSSNLGKAAHNDFSDNEEQQKLMKEDLDEL